MKTKAIVAIMVTVLLVFSAFHILPVRAQNYLKIGVIGPQGWPQWDGMREGAELARDWINGLGGGIVIDGVRYDVSLHYGDEHAADLRPDLGALEMERLIDMEQCDVVFGGFRTECTSAMREVAMDYQTIYTICGASTNDLIDCGTGTCGACVRCDYSRYKYLFRATPVNSTMLVYNILGFFYGYLLPWRMAPVYGVQLDADPPLDVKVAVIAEDLAWTVPLYYAFVYGGYLGPYANIVYAARTPYTPGSPYDFTYDLDAMHAAQVRLIVHLYSTPDSIALVTQMAAHPIKTVLAGIDETGQTTEFWTWTGGKCEYETLLATSGTRTPISTVSQPYTTTEVWDLCYAAYGHAPIHTMWGVYDSIIAWHDMLEGQTAITPPFNLADNNALVPLVEATDREGVLGKFKFTQYHDVFSNEYGPTWNQRYVRPFWVQWQAGRQEVVCPMGQPYSKYWSLPDADGSMYPYPPDIDQDGDVDFWDAMSIRNAWGSYPTPPDEPSHPRWWFGADVDRDDFVGFFDAMCVLDRYGHTVALPLPYCDEGGFPIPERPDVAVTNVTPDGTVVDQGYSMSIDVIVENQGFTTETFDVTAYYGSATITPPQWDTFWSMGDANRDGYVNEADRDVVEAALGSTPSDPNYCLYADINLDWIVNNLDLAILDMHYGLDVWTYFVSGAIIDTQTVNNLSPGDSTTLVFTWDTTGVAPGSYTISAYAVPILCEEGACADNNFGDGVVTVVTPEDRTQELIETIVTWDLPAGTEKSLTQKLEAVLGLLEQGNENGAIHKLMDFIKQVEAKRGKKLTDEQADLLIAEAQRIIDVIEG